MEEVNLSDIKFAYSSALNRAIVCARNNLASAWVNDIISKQQLDDAIATLDNALALAKVAINNAESQSEIDDIVADLKQHLRNYAKRNGLSCEF